MITLDDKDKREIQNDIEMMVEQLFPMDELTTTVDDFLQCQTHQQCHVMKNERGIDERA